VESKGDEMGVKSSDLAQMKLITSILEVPLTIISSPHNSSKGASSRYGLTKVSSFNLASESSSVTLISPLEGSLISYPMH